jgi:preprotein translocase subunit YajC
MREMIVLAQAAGGNQFLIPGLVFFGVMLYLLILRPQQKQLKDQQALMGSLKKGDDVVTQAGILGKVIQIQDKIITLEIASSLKVRVLKSTIQGKLSEEPVKAAEEPKEAEKKEER